ncbi:MULTISPECIES: ABC transporter ATP-binding protein [Pimelobacter]|uniref:ABC transporter ATP-binding protein n=1 Tax=Pimelobacter TaxID=2044 RepID=UPI001C041AA7|nr:MULTISPECIES: ABC transporter ATP-binding protein [Pimelobacter]MBU2693781.1 ABC transporter [Pimelobacter sp. 30-1]UUW90673.1 ABC transporter ATP-binding protein [Pimelobacter simplex]UUW94502.1 ABC transporter ATP-binding protein [Pimelobacter simplex]
MSFEEITPRPPAALWARGIVRSYGDQQVLRGVDFAAASGESVALTGPSGSGKTTLLHVLSGIAVPDAGEVVLAAAGSAPVAVAKAGAEERARLRRGTFGMVFQSGQLLAELTAVENVALPLLLEGRPAREAQAAAAAMFAPLGLDGLQERRPGELSGGQQQRVAIARALVPRPTVLFADEPTGALDRRTGEQVMGLLLDAQRATGVTLVVVTHDPEIAARCDRVVTLRDGAVR